MAKLVMKAKDQSKEKACSRIRLDYEISQKTCFWTRDTFHTKWPIVAGWLYGPQETHYEPLTAPVASYRFIYDEYRPAEHGFNFSLCI